MTTPVVASVTTRPLRLPMRQPFITARGKKHVSRNLLVQVALSNGTTGIGEASASLAWKTETLAVMTRCVTAVAAQWRSRPVAEAWAVIGHAWDAPWASPAALSALECALATAEAQANGRPLWRALAGRLGMTRARPRRIMTSLTISAWPREIAARAAGRAAHQGFRQLKVKVTGRDPDEDLARVLLVHQAAPAATLLVDANQGFSARGALAFARAIRLLKLPVVLFEQPVPADDLDGLRALTRDAGIPIAVDESLRSARDARRLIQRRAAHCFNVKLAKSGLLGTLEITRLARRAHLTLMLGCMAESAVGLAPSVHLACGTGLFTYVDLDSHLLVRGPRATAFQTRGPRLWVNAS